MLIYREGKRVIRGVSAAFWFSAFAAVRLLHTQSKPLPVKGEKSDIFVI